MPIVRSYVKDANKLLVRPDCSFNRQWLSEADLFEPGNAVLTAKGRAELDKLVPWLEGLKHTGSEVVIAGYADASTQRSADSGTHFRLRHRLRFRPRD